MDFNPSNLLELPQAFKLAELVFTFITMMVFRLGNDGSPVGILDHDKSFLQNLACLGFFMICLVQVIGIVFGEKGRRVQDTLLAILGFFLFLAGGAVMAEHVDNLPTKSAPGIAMASMMIITSFVFLADAIFSVINFNKIGA